jgi:hypothetical protein
MRHLIALVPLLFAVSASAAIKAEAPMADGAMVYLHDTAGPCVGRALQVQYIDAAGASSWGCWVQNAPTHISMVFLDGDIGRVAVEALRPPKGV